MFDLTKFSFCEKMRVLYVIVSVTCMVLCANCDIDLKESLVSHLPPVFHIDKNYELCGTQGKLFCKVSVLLTSIDTNNVSYYWELIEESIKDKAAYSRNELFHAICVEDFCGDIINSEKYDNLGEILSNCYSRKYGHLGLTANVTNYRCSNQDRGHRIGLFDLIWLCTLVAYGIYIIYASLWDYNRRYKNKKSVFISPNFGNTYLIPFSLINNWQKLKEENQNPDFQRLKCIQGIRFYNTLLIIFCHTCSSYIGGYIQNTTYIEEVPNNPIRHGIRNLLMFLVQTFFLISAFLLSNHILQIIDSTKEFNKRYMFLTFLNRYLRLVPPVLIMISLGSTSWMLSFFDGPIKDLYSDLEYRRCRKNWWTVLLLINNHYDYHDMCYFITWYLAADTQLYILSLVILSLMWKYRNKTKMILTLCTIVGVVIPIIISYIYNLDIMFRITPENSKNDNFRSFTFNAIYCSTYANMATYMVGLCLGYIYYKTKDHTIFNNLIRRLLWWIGMFGLPILVLIISSYYYTRFYSAILCGILKPLFALGIGIGILGMSQQVGGIVKYICEWRPAVLLGNFTYSTYVAQYVVVFYRTATATQPLYISDHVLITSFLCDAVLSFICGFILHVTVEMPALQLQNTLVPQVRPKRYSNLDKKN